MFNFNTCSSVACGSTPRSGALTGLFWRTGSHLETRVIALLKRMYAKATAPAPMRKKERGTMRTRARAAARGGGGGGGGSQDDDDEAPPVQV